jgi:hypothetical protein
VLIRSAITNAGNAHNTHQVKSDLTDGKPHNLFHFSLLYASNYTPEAASSSVPVENQKDRHATSAKPFANSKATNSNIFKQVQT